MATARRTPTTKSPKRSKPVSAPEIAKVAVETVNLQEAIRTRAYSCYEERGFIHGHDVDDWLRAENEVMSHFEARG